MPTQNYGFTGGWKSWNVPKGVKSVTVEVKGGGSGSRPAGRVAGKIAVHDDNVLWIAVGAAGDLHSGKTSGGPVFGGGGRGGNSGAGHQGGDGGGGASVIRMNSRTGTVKCVAGGAGGSSGDSGAGGRGGDESGESGAPGTAGTDSVGNASGGTQIQGGNGGTSSSGSQYNGHSAPNTVLASGGGGGQVSVVTSHGGGGGGGGFRAGGGGQASSIGFTPGGGGGGGSNFSGGLTGFQNERGTGGTGPGVVTLTWVSPPPANQPPSSVSDIKINGKAESDGLPTKSTGTVTVSATLNDPNRGHSQTKSGGTKDDPSKGQHVRMRILISTTSDFVNSWERVSEFVEQGKRADIKFTGLSQNTHYFMRIWAQDSKGLKSLAYNSANFWTNRSPNPPELVTPSENQQFSTLVSIPFTWNHKDPDPGDNQTAFEIRWRKAATATTPVGTWSGQTVQTSFEGYTTDPGQFRSSTSYDWTVRTRDVGRAWGSWAIIKSFYITGVSKSPTLLNPVNGAAVDVTESLVFRWRFNDPDVGASQTKADVRYRVVGSVDWVTIVGDTTTPGAEGRYPLPSQAVQAGFHYEWEARTYDTLSGLPSDWSEPETFWTIGAPGSDGGVIIPELIQVAPGLGCGTHRVFIYDRGGKVNRGEITPIASLQWSRKRDDISNCLLTTNGFGEDCGSLLGEIRSWMHEIVIFRDGVRVWEGPITRIGYKVGEVEIEAKDVMAYVYRRIMRQGFNDAYRLVDGILTGQTTVVERAAQITMNALAPSDPNVLPYMTLFEFPDDARQSRSVPDYSKTAWEEIDDLAATAGLDYTVLGRRIMYWDTHRPIGRLAEMRDNDFSEPPVVTEYGMSLANYFAVTNNTGVWGAASKGHAFYGPIEQLASAYGESATAEPTVLTPDGLENLRNILEDQAKRNIAGRWPTPLIVRVPDNAALNPDLNVGINQLVPGVWIPLRSTATVRQVAQWQKLDSVTVNEAEGRETVAVVMSPAPNQGQDPDLDQQQEPV